MTKDQEKNILISALACSLSSAAAILPILANISEAYPDWSMWVQSLATIPALFIMMSSLIVSPLLRFLSEKKLTIIGLLLILIGGVYPYFIHSFPLLILSRVLIGIGLGFINTISSSLPAKYFNEGKARDKATGLQAAFSSFGGVIFSFLSGYIANIFWKGAFLVQLLNLLPLVAVLFLMKSKDESITYENKDKDNLKGEIFVVEALPLMILAFMTFSLTITFPINLSFFVKENAMGTTNVTGIITSVNSFLGFLIGLSYSKINTFFKNKTLGFSLVLLSLSFFIMSQAKTPSILLLGSTLFGIGTSVIYPSFLTTIYKEISPSKVVASVGMYTVASNIAQFISPFIINPLASLLGQEVKYRFIFCSFALILLAILVFVVSSSEKEK